LVAVAVLAAVNMVAAAEAVGIETLSLQNLLVGEVQQKPRLL
tara:strand:+ start:218 stop:343 length:126 start_codon:yes stop_codon:yes gene_type:complete